MWTDKSTVWPTYRLLWPVCLVTQSISCQDDVIFIRTHCVMFGVGVKAVTHLLSDHYRDFYFCINLFLFLSLPPSLPPSPRTTHVPIGHDQLQHIELTRDIAKSFNSAYSSSVFIEPQPLLGKGFAPLIRMRF